MAKRKGKGKKQLQPPQPAANDDDEGLRRRGLPIDDYMESNDPLPDSVPSSGLEYLRMVRREAQMCEAVVRSSVSVKAKPATHGAALPDLRAQFFGEAFADRTPALPEQLRASPEWVFKFLSEFNELRKIVLKEAAKKSSEYALALPKAKSEAAWKRFCYGIVDDMPAAATNEPEEMAVCTKDEVQEADEEEEGELSVDPGYAQLIGEVGSGYDADEPAPLLNITTAMSHEATMRVLQYHLNWLKGDELTAFQAQWLFALLARVETPLVFEDNYVLRELCRKCQSIRAERLRKGGVVGTGDADPTVMGVRVVVTIVAGCYGQKDLSDDVADRPPAGSGGFDDELADRMEVTVVIK
ncbi:gem (nuclear organelle) associated protein 2 [Phlyctochytrium bullatum]|nr:gem (nuclear organelle) associated protein 2 [Phlyctochytrium bullatum]